MHAEARAFVNRVVEDQKWGAPGKFDSVLEVGSRNINGGVRDLLGDCDYYGLDLEPGPGVDEVADVTTWATDRTFDAVICCEVLEHAPDPEKVVRACLALLRRGGRLILTAACEPRAPHSGHDGAQVRPGEHYGNVDPEALRGWLPEHPHVEVHSRGDVYALAVRW